LLLQTLDVLWHLTLALHYYIYYYYYICQQIYAGYLQLHTWNKCVSTAHNVGAVMYLQTLLHIILISTWNMFCTLTFWHEETCALSNMAVFIVVWYHALTVCWWGTVWVIMRCFQLLLLLQVLLLFSQSICSKFLLEGLYILEYSQLLS
jgi:hypothetical protein